MATTMRARVEQVLANSQRNLTATKTAETVDDDTVTNTGADVTTNATTGTSIAETTSSSDASRVTVETLRNDDVVVKLSSSAPIAAAATTQEDPPEKTGGDKNNPSTTNTSTSTTEDVAAATSSSPSVRTTRTESDGSLPRVDSLTFLADTVMKQMEQHHRHNRLVRNNNNNNNNNNSSNSSSTVNGSKTQSQMQRQARTASMSSNAGRSSSEHLASLYAQYAASTVPSSSSSSTAAANGDGGGEGRGGGGTLRRSGSSVGLNLADRSGSFTNLNGSPSLFGSMFIPSAVSQTTTQSGGGSGAFRNSIHSILGGRGGGFSPKMPSSPSTTLRRGVPSLMDLQGSRGPSASIGLPVWDQLHPGDVASAASTASLTSLMVDRVDSGDVGSVSIAGFTVNAKAKKKQTRSNKRVTSSKSKTKGGGGGVKRKQPPNGRGGRRTKSTKTITTKRRGGVLSEFDGDKNDTKKRKRGRSKEESKAMHRLVERRRTKRINDVIEQLKIEALSAEEIADKKKSDKVSVLEGALRKLKELKKTIAVLRQGNGDEDAEGE